MTASVLTRGRIASRPGRGASGGVRGAALLAVGLSLLLTGATAQQTATPKRRVSASERGGIFMIPARAGKSGAEDWSGLGIFVGHIGDKLFEKLSPDAIKVAHGRFQYFAPYDEKHWALFPYDELKAFEAREIAAGRDPIFVTATYQGKKRPVYFRWSLQVSGGGERPTSPAEMWMQAVSVGDDRFIRFWIDNYARKAVTSSMPNMWIGLDACAFMYSLYGVLDDEGKFVPGVPWDKPFPPSEPEFYRSVETFFKRIKALAPDIHAMCNLGSMGDWSQYQEVFADVPGLMVENIYDSNPKAYARTNTYYRLRLVSWMADQDRVGLLRAYIPPGDRDYIRTALVTYLLVRGDNFFFAPRASKSRNEIPPENYEPMRRALGDPTETMQSRKEPGGQTDGYRLYWRRCERGIVYLNETGKAQTITLPTDRPYYDDKGKPVTQLQVKDMAGDYALTSPPQG